VKFSTIDKLYRSHFIMADVDQANIDSTIAALEQGITSIPVEQATTVIEAWEQQLRGLAIADDLAELKDALRKGKSADARNFG
jgi:hypothetical protein